MGQHARWVVLGAVALMVSACSTEQEETEQPAHHEPHHHAPEQASDVTVLVEGIQDARFLALDVESVFFLAPSAGDVRRVPRTGGPVTTVAHAGGWPTHLAVDETAVYWIERRSDDPSARKDVVVKLDKAGGQPTVIASDIGGPTALALDAEHVFVATATGSILRISKYGGPAARLFDGSLDARGLVSDGAWVYWTDGATGNVSRLPRTLPSEEAPSAGVKTSAIYHYPEVLSTGNDVPAAIALDGDRVLWVNATSGTLLSAPMGGGASTVVTGGVDGETRIVVDGAFAYVTAISGASVLRCGRELGDVVPITDVPAPLADIGVDGDHLFGIQGGSDAGAIVALQLLGD